VPDVGMHGLWVACGFLTRIPVGDVSRGGAREVDVAKAVPWFPVVGLFIGGVAGASYVGALEFFAPSVAAALAVAVTLLVTGAFHHDGLADIADAFGGGWNVEQRMTILKDSRLGTYGTAALALALITEVVALSQLGAREGLETLLVAHTLGRSMALAAMLLAPTAGDGMGAAYVEHLSPLVVTIGIMFGMLVTALLSPIFPLVTIGAASAVAVAVVALAIRKIGGITGDVLGAVTVLSSLAVVVTAGAI
jgi:adenosylcobinamide-GDP ribazoletransferase